MFAHKTCYFLLWSLLPCLALSSLPIEYQDQVCVSAIRSGLDGLVFAGIASNRTTDDEYYENSCLNRLRITSILATAKIYCSNPAVYKPGVERLRQECAKEGYQQLSEMQLAANLTPEAIQGMVVVNMSEADPDVVLNNPVVLDEHSFELIYRAEDDWAYEYRTHWFHGFAMYGFWGIFLVSGMLHNLYKYATKARAFAKDVEAERRYDSRSHKPTMLTRASAFIQKHIILPSILPPYHRQHLLWCSIPTRMEGLVVGSFWIFSLILCATNLRAYSGNNYYPSLTEQTLTYMADRCGIIAYANLAWIWIFSGRNNVLIWATGWRFATFNVFHRHVARVATLQGVVHAAGYTGLYFVGGYGSDYRSSWQETWWYMGAAAVISMSFLVMFSSMWFRAKVYELFLIVHIALAVVVLVGLWCHTEIWEGDYDPYIWAPVAIWCFDRFLRVVRLLYCNLYVNFSKGSIHRTRATVQYDAASGTITLHVDSDFRGPFKPSPGQHYYLYQPRRWTGWESHPFTLAFWKFGRSSRVKTRDSGSLTQAVELPDTRELVSDEKSPAAANAHENVAAETSSILPEIQRDETRLTFWISPFDGWTRSIRRRCEASPTSTVATTVLIEGPYGERAPLWDYDEVLLLAGGSGIAAAAPYVVDYVSRAVSSKPIRTRGVRLVWASRHLGFIRRVGAAELGHALKREDVAADLYYTGKSNMLASSELQASGDVGGRPASGQNSPAEQSLLDSSLAVHHGRPDICAIIRDVLTSAKHSGTRVAILVCGPGIMADAARAATQKAMPGNIDLVGYFEEAFGW